MLTMITGPDAFLVRSALDGIKARVDPTGLNTSTHEAKIGSIEEIVTALGTPGFFGGTRLLIVSELMTVASKGRAGDLDDEDAQASKATVDWGRVFASIAPGNAAVFVDRDLSGIPVAVKKALPKDAEVIAGDPPRGSELIQWMRSRAVAAQSGLTEMDARFLAELLSPTTWTSKPSNPAYDGPPDLELFANEIDKLALAAYPDSIERRHIVEMTAAGQPDRLFPLIDAVIAAEGSVAVKELAAALQRGDDASRISAQLYQQAELIAALNAAGQVDPVELGRAIGLSNPNRMIAISKSTRRLRAKPDRLLGASLEIERQFKRGVLRQPADQTYALIEKMLAVARETREGGT